MKKLFFILIMSLYCMSVFASFQVGSGLDLGTAQDFIVKSKGYSINGDVRIKLTDSFEARTVAGLTKNNSAQLIEIGVFAVYYPFVNRGMFAGLSLFQFGFVKPLSILSKNMVSLNEIILGWTINTKKGFYVEPSITIRDPSGAFSDEYSLLKGAFACYGTFRIHLNAGWKFTFDKETQK